MTQGVGFPGLPDVGGTPRDVAAVVNQILRRLKALAASGGAPSSAEYITAATDPTLTAERVATSTATVIWDFTTAGQAKANVGTLNTIPAPVASVNFAQQQAVSFVIENRTSDPGSPVAGQIWLRTDL